VVACLRLSSCTRRLWLQTLSGAAAAAALPGARAAVPAKAPIAWPRLSTVHGQALDLVPGVPLIVVFWATWCGYCQRHNAHIERLHRSVDPSRLRVLGVAADRDAAAVRQYLHSHSYHFPVVLDEGRVRPLFTPRRILPMTCAVDAAGSPGLCIPGEMTEDDVMSMAKLALPAAR